MYKICFLILFSLNGISQLKVIKTEKYKRSPNEVTIVGVLGYPIENNKKPKVEHTILEFTVDGIDTTYLPFFGSIESTLPQNLNHFQEFWNSIYYSAITFFTIGYGDYFPYGPLKFVAAIEGFSGVFLMSYFTVAFVRKILR